MAYTPSLEDITQHENSSGYKPSLSDIPEERSVNPRQLLNEFMRFDKPDYTALQSFAQGMAKGGQKIAQLLPGAPNYNFEGVFGNKTTNPQAEFAGQYLPTLISGVAGIPGIIGSGLYGATQSEPNNRLKEGLYSGLGALGGNLLGTTIKGTGSLINQLRGKLTPTSIAKVAQNSHDLMKKNAEKIFSGVSRNASERGIDNIPLDKSVIDEAKDFLPKTRANKKLLDRAETGNYDALRDLQSDLGKRGFKRKSSDLASENDEGEEMLDTREKINEAISNHFRNTGNNDLANELDKGRKLYSNFKDIYYSRPSLAKMVNEDLRLVPKNVSSIFNENSIPMERFRQAHPEIKNSLSQLKTLNNLKKLGISTGTAGGIGGLLYGYNQLNKRSSSGSSRED